MNYPSSLQYLNQFINLEKLSWRPEQRLYNLDRMRFLLDLFDHPEKNFFPVIIAGTKGKGSTGFFLESILKEAGIRVGFYNSPHVLKPTERIRLNGNDISEKDWARELTCLRSKLPRKEMGFTYFEILTLLAILVFARKKIQVGIFEVGMGGRLDATNILKAPLVILTPISLDHEAILGNTIAKIATEKAGVIHAGAKVIVGNQPREAMRVIEKRAKEVKAKMLYARKASSFNLGLEGEHQRENASLAIKAAEILMSSPKFFIGDPCALSLGFGFPASPAGRPTKPFGNDSQNIRSELPPTMIHKALQKTNWQGRFERIEKKPDLIIDGAHNPASIRVLMNLLKKEYRDRNKILIFGTSRDKNHEEMLGILGECFKTAIFTAAQFSRARENCDLALAARPYFSTIFVAMNAQEALKRAKELVSPRDMIIATGSFYLIGEISKLIKKKPVTSNL